MRSIAISINIRMCSKRWQSVVIMAMVVVIVMVDAINIRKSNKKRNAHGSTTQKISSSHDSFCRNSQRRDKMSDVDWLPFFSPHWSPHHPVTLLIFWRVILSIWTVSRENTFLLLIIKLQWILLLKVIQFIPCRLFRSSKWESLNLPLLLSVKGLLHFSSSSSWYYWLRYSQNVWLKREEFFRPEWRFMFRQTSHHEWNSKCGEEKEKGNKSSLDGSGWCSDVNSLNEVKGSRWEVWWSPLSDCLLSDHISCSHFFPCRLVLFFLSFHALNPPQVYSLNFRCNLKFINFCQTRLFPSWSHDCVSYGLLEVMTDAGEGGDADIISLPVISSWRTASTTISLYTKCRNGRIIKSDDVLGESSLVTRSWWPWWFRTWSNGGHFTRDKSVIYLDIIRRRTWDLGLVPIMGSYQHDVDDQHFRQK